MQKNCQPRGFPQRVPKRHHYAHASVGLIPLLVAPHPVADCDVDSLHKVKRSLDRCFESKT